MKAFWNNGAPRTVREGSLDAISGRFIGTRADPNIDLYDYIEVGQQVGRFEVPGPRTFTKDGTTITATCSTTAWSRERVLQVLRQDVKSKRDAVMNAGIEWSPDGGTTVYIVQTDAASRDNIDGEVTGLDKSGELSTTWRMRDNSWVTLTAAEFLSMALAVRGHVKACYANQAALEAQLELATDPTTVPLDAGWPAHYVVLGNV